MKPISLSPIMCGKLPAPDRREGEHLKSVRQHPAQPVRAAELDVVVDRVIVAGNHLEGGEMRFRHGAARIAIDLADFRSSKLRAAP